MHGTGAQTARNPHRRLDIYTVKPYNRKNTKERRRHIRRRLQPPGGAGPGEMRFCGMEKYGDLSMPGRTRRTEKTMMEFLRAHQLNMMLFMSGICGILAFLSLISNGYSCHKMTKKYRKKDSLPDRQGNPV